MFLPPGSYAQRETTFQVLTINGTLPFVEHYNEARPHSHRNHRPPLEQAPVPEWETIRLEEVVCRERLGGVIKSYRRAA